MPISLLGNRKTRGMTGSNQPCFRSMNGLAPSYSYIDKILDALWFENYLSLSKDQKLRLIKLL